MHTFHGLNDQLGTILHHYATETSEAIEATPLVHFIDTARAVNDTVETAKLNANQLAHKVSEITTLVTENAITNAYFLSEQITQILELSLAKAGDQIEENIELAQSRVDLMLRTIQLYVASQLNIIVYDPSKVDLREELKQTDTTLVDKDGSVYFKEGENIFKFTPNDPRDTSKGGSTKMIIFDDAGKQEEIEILSANHKEIVTDKIIDNKDGTVSVAKIALTVTDESKEENKHIKAVRSKHSSDSTDKDSNDDKHTNRRFSKTVSGNENTHTRVEHEANTTVTVATNEADLNFRSFPSTNSDEVTYPDGYTEVTISDGDTLTLTGNSVYNEGITWLEVTFEDNIGSEHTGWVASGEGDTNYLETTVADLTIAQIQSSTTTNATAQTVYTNPLGSIEVDNDDGYIILDNDTDDNLLIVTNSELAEAAGVTHITVDNAGEQVVLSGNAGIAKGNDTVFVATNEADEVVGFYIQDSSNGSNETTFVPISENVDGSNDYTIYAPTNNGGA
ncbi:MAG: SH3 domain-containing protein [Candidatus Dojkabacteria bacterium]|nr:SH3 domain-containing protein [Candidatus Dojkabacteria bacterium]